MGEVNAGHDHAEFRREVREWLETNCPPEMRDGAAGESSICWGGTTWVFTCEAQKIWLDRCAARGFTVPTWPKAYGGAGFSRDEDKILKQEMQAIGARSPLDSFGIWMLGPALLKFGTE
ncbi:acyl-CoA dehydrogenase family protein, partial [Pseudophaeobacter sp.]